jgi:hypothetical protein
LDFTAPSGISYLPYWVIQLEAMAHIHQMMKKLELEEGDQITLTNVKLPKGEHVKLEPHESEWLDIPENIRKSVYLQFT